MADPRWPSTSEFETHVHSSASCDRAACVEWRARALAVEGEVEKLRTERVFLTSLVKSAGARAAELAVRVSDLERGNAIASQRAAELERERDGMQVIVDAVNSSRESLTDRLLKTEARATREAAGRDALGELLGEWAEHEECLDCQHGDWRGTPDHHPDCRVHVALAALAADRKGGTDGP